MRLTGVACYVLCRFIEGMRDAGARLFGADVEGC
jgi:hypothetical protein